MNRLLAVIRILCLVLMACMTGMMVMADDVPPTPAPQPTPAPLPTPNPGPAPTPAAPPAPADVFDNPYCDAEPSTPPDFEPYCPFPSAPDYACLDQERAQYQACMDVWNAQACAAYDALLQTYDAAVATAGDNQAACNASGTSPAICYALRNAECAEAKATLEADTASLASDFKNNADTCWWVAVGGMSLCGCIRPTDQ